MVSAFAKVIGRNHLVDMIYLDAAVSCSHYKGSIPVPSHEYRAVLISRMIFAIPWGWVFS